MKPVVKKIFCLLWLLFFLQDALEVSACGIENTFNDEYDTYIAASTVNVSATVCVTIDCDSAFISAALISWNFATLPQFTFSRLYEDSRPPCSNPPPLHVLYAVWVI